MKDKGLSRGRVSLVAGLACAVLVLGGPWARAEERIEGPLYVESWGGSYAESEANAHDIPMVTTGAGTAFGVHFGQTEPPRNYRETLKTDKEKYSAFRHHMLQNKIQLLPDGRWYVGLAHTKAELEKSLAAIRKSFKAVASESA